MKPKLIYFISLIAILAILSAGYLLYKYQTAQSELQRLATKTSDQSTKIINQVGLLIQLPTNEIPTVGTITDKDKLKNQSFFTPAENGDQLLIYVQAKKAILYRPSINKIIDMSSISPSSPSAQTKTSP